jgi:hypothetical protein
VKRTKNFVRPPPTFSVITQEIQMTSANCLDRDDGHGGGVDATFKCTSDADTLLSAKEPLLHSSLPEVGLCVSADHSNVTTHIVSEYAHQFRFFFVFGLFCFVFFFAIASDPLRPTLGVSFPHTRIADARWTLNAATRKGVVTRRGTTKKR